METKNFIYAIKGMTFGFLIFLLLFSSLLTVPVSNAAQQSPLFSITLICSTTNPVRRQHAALTASAMQSVGIDARVVYMGFGDLIGKLFPEKSMIGKTFAQGGYDIGFLGYGMTSPIPDIKNQYYGSNAAFPPDGNNYALYNSSEANKLLNQIYTQLDPVKQLALFKQFSIVINRDKPYVNIYLTKDVVARRPEIKLFGDANVFSSMTSYFSDIQYMSGLTSFTFAEAGDWKSLAPWVNVDSNSFYSLFVYGATQGGLQLVDPRTQTFYLSEAESITPSTDGRTWTIKIKPGILWQDGVEETADDYLFSEQVQMEPDVHAYGLSDKLARFGTLVEFDYLDGSKVLVDNSGGTLTTPTTVFKTLDKYTYTFTIDPSVPLYAFLGQTECAIAAMPKHYLEQIPFSQYNQLTFATGLGGPYTYTWDTTKYGGSGTYTAYGPVGVGPYVYKGYDPVKRLATLVKFNDYFDKARLEALGEFTVNNYYVVTIVEKDAAIAAYRTGDIDALDVNYQLGSDVDVLTSLGANVFLGGVNGWQEMGFNLQSPIVGTGLGTPVGQADPTKAAEAARHVRQAISYLIPRDLVVKQLLNGDGESGTTTLKVFGSGYQDPSTTVDPYDPIKARAELAAAGYNTGVSPITPITPPSNVTANYLFGQAIPVSGIFKNPVTGDPFVNFVIRIQESKDNATWIDTPYAPLTNSQGIYSSMIVPDTKVSYFRAYFTGYTVSVSQSAGWPITGGDYYDQLVKDGKVQQVLPPQIGPVTKVTTNTMTDLLTNALKPLATKTDLTSLTTQVTTLKTSVDSLKSSVDSLTNYLYISIAVAVIALIVAGYSLMKK